MAGNLPPFQRLVLLTEGHTDPRRAKTAVAMLRYRAEMVAAILESSSAGMSAEQLFGVGGSIPVVASLDEVDGPDSLLLGIAPSGGRLPASWRQPVLESLSRGMIVLSGLHDMLGEDAAFVKAASEGGGQIIDLRASDFCQVAGTLPLGNANFRILTVGNDCSCGKMVTSLALVDGLLEAEHDAQFVATGQTGILLAGSGIALDHIRGDYIAGAAELLAYENREHEILVIEGQGSLIHPRYAGVTLALLHGCRPHGLLYCHEMGRTEFFGMQGMCLPDHEEVIDFYLRAARFARPSCFLGIAVYGGAHTDEEVDSYCEQLEDRHGLPACDVLRHGPSKLVKAVLAAQR